MTPPSYKCPKCGGDHFKRWQLPHPYILHWVLNPGLAVNELVLGQRVTKTQLICQDCDGPMMDRAYVPCPSCGTMHLGRRASGRQGFGNWRGIACPTCHQPIPCIRNVFSLLILLLTFPLWFLPYYLYFRKQPLRLLFLPADEPPPPLKPPKPETFIMSGLIWGAWMWGVMTLLPLALKKDHTHFWQSAISDLPIWAGSGFLFAAFLWIVSHRNLRKARISK
jgi:predicted RNA-binding Zn-ribbon protein involved in translation (DUF1610 family)